MSERGATATDGGGRSAATGGGGRGAATGEARRSGGRVVGAGAAASALALLGAPAIARAEYVPGQYVVSPGLSFSVAFGGRSGVELGVMLDVRGTVLLDGRRDPCSSDARSGVGVYAAIGWYPVGWYHRTGWRFGAGAHGGVEIGGPVLAIDGEVGWVYHIGRGAGPSTHELHIGGIAQIGSPWTLGRASLGLPFGIDVPLSTPAAGLSATAGLGVRAPTIFGLFQTCNEGRPLRDGDDLLLPAVCVGGPVPLDLDLDRDLDPDARAALAAAWLEAARAECASVPAFLALARDLVRVGAPPSLVERARAAAGDEVRHARMASALASRFAGIALAPIRPPTPAARDVDDRAATLRRLAVESWTDGCVVEGAALARAAAARPHATGAARRALDVIVPDEARHAELAFDVLAFALAAGGRPVRTAVGDAAATVATAPSPAAEEPAPPDVDPALLSAHGYRDPAPALVAATLTGARRRLDRLLAATT